MQPDAAFQEFLDSIKVNGQDEAHTFDSTPKGAKMCNCIWLLDTRTGGRLHAHIGHSKTLCGMDLSKRATDDGQYDSPECSRCRTLLEMGVLEPW